MWRATLSRPLPVAALVGRYPTNKLIGHGPIPRRRSFARRNMRSRGVIRYYRRFRKVLDTSVKDAAIPEPGVRYPCIPHPFATNFPSSYPSGSPFDLHALATPPAFVLSQDQTLRFRFVSESPPAEAGNAQMRSGAYTLTYARENASQPERLFTAPDGIVADPTHRDPAPMGCQIWWSFKANRQVLRNGGRPPHSHDDNSVHLSKSRHQGR